MLDLSPRVTDTFVNAPQATARVDISSEVIVASPQSAAVCSIDGVVVAQASSRATASSGGDVVGGGPGGGGTVGGEGSS
jgi:uncharacterized membrane protein